MSSFKLTPAAFASLKSISRYTKEQWGDRQRNIYMRALDARFYDLARYPDKGKSREELSAGVHSFPEGKHVIYYRLHKKYITILDVLHERMDAKAKL